jgi:glycosyltransferase involved in cell wall biosynthesis
MTAPRLRVLALASKPWGMAPGQRFRFEQWAPHLARDHGIDLELLPFESARLTEVLYKPGHYPTKAWRVSRDFVRRASAVRKARAYDAVLLFREAALIGPAIYERLLAKTGTPMIYDFDDSIWMQQPDVNRSIFSLLHFHRKTKTICRVAAAVSAGNDFLADYARLVNSNVHVVPTTIELGDYDQSPEPGPGGPFIVCWTGSTTTLVHFEHARPALEQLASRLPLAVKIICNEPPKQPVAGAEMRFVPWSAEAEAREIAQSHVGIMPLPDNEFSRGKCGLKALQCMAAARPVVVSPVGVNTAIVEHGRNGFLASTTEEFVDALTQLASSPELRARLGAAAYETVKENYSASIGAAKFADVVRSVR